MANYCVLFFPENQDSEVLPESSVIDGSVTVGRHVSIQRKDNKLYDGNILYIGSEDNCDAKIQYVTTTGQLKNTAPLVVRGIFRTTWHQLSPVPLIPPPQKLSNLKSCDETAGIIQDLQKRIPRLREPGLLFSSIFVHIYINSPHLDEVTSDESHYTLLPATQVENIKKTKSTEIRTSD
uniref:Dynactin subunit 6 n=1 Tax=Heterorhabditis bacteriophora TaxID=37862 RepID=A0A1I7X4R6_HETBA